MTFRPFTVGTSGRAGWVRGDTGGAGKKDKGGCDELSSYRWPSPAGALPALVSVSSYAIGSQAAGKVPLPPDAEFPWWYQFYSATERGRVGYEK